MLLSELNIRLKTLLGQGYFHSVFPFEKFQDKIIKTRWGDLEFFKKNLQ